MSSQPVRSFRDLRVYRAAREVGREVFRLTKEFPKEERYALTDQVRRSSRAIKAMVAEAWGRRRYKAVFINKIDEALGECTETQSWLDDALDAAYISQEQFETLDRRYEGIGGMLTRMIDRADDFCKHPPSVDYRTLREDPPTPDDDFFADDDLPLPNHQSPITNHPWNPLAKS